MMRHKKTPSSEEASDNRLDPRPTSIQAVDILAGNLEERNRENFTSAAPKSKTSVSPRDLTKILQKIF